MLLIIELCSVSGSFSVGAVLDPAGFGWCQNASIFGISAVSHCVRVRANCI